MRDFRYYQITKTKRSFWISIRSLGRTGGLCWTPMMFLLKLNYFNFCFQKKHLSKKLASMLLCPFKYLSLAAPIYQDRQAQSIILYEFSSLRRFRQSWKQTSLDNLTCVLWTTSWRRRLIDCFSRSRASWCGSTVTPLFSKGMRIAQPLPRPLLPNPPTLPVYLITGRILGKSFIVTGLTHENWRQ